MKNTEAMFGVTEEQQGLNEGWRILNFGETHNLWVLGINNHPDIETASFMLKRFGPHAGNSTHDLHRTKLTEEQLRAFIMAEAEKRGMLPKKP